MAKVSLNLLNIFALQVKKNSIDFEGSTVGDIISQFIKDHHKVLDPRLLNKSKKKLNEQILILVNGKNIDSLKKYKTKLSEGDKLYISVALSGG